MESREDRLTQFGKHAFGQNQLRSGLPTAISNSRNIIIVAMSNLLPQSCLRQLTRNPLRQTSLPIFLAPAYSHPLRTQCFSTTSPTQSRVGGAPISIPPEVSLKFIDLPQTQVRGRSKEIPKTAIEVKGPLGKRRCCILECLRNGI
jgi:hypothetical protein